MRPPRKIIEQRPKPSIGISGEKHHEPVRENLGGYAMSFLKYLFPTLGNLILILLAMLFLGAGILLSGYTGNLDEIALERAVMIGIGIVIAIFVGYRIRRQRQINY